MTPQREHAIGEAWRAMAHSEGHRKKFPPSARNFNSFANRQANDPNLTPTILAQVEKEMIGRGWTRAKDLAEEFLWRADTVSSRLSEIYLRGDADRRKVCQKDRPWITEYEYRLKETQI